MLSFILKFTKRNEKVFIVKDVLNYFFLSADATKKEKKKLNQKSKLSHALIINLYLYQFFSLQLCYHRDLFRGHN